MIEVTGFHKMYDGTIAVQDMNFTVDGGQILGLVGPNGAGKTTTLRCIAGIIPPTCGRLAVAGHDIVADPIAAKRELASVPDDPKLYDALTVWEHLQFIAATYRVDHFAERAEVLLDKFELVEKRNTVAAELSRGMRQKVAICCAYLHDPNVILFDEPLTGLDPRAIRTINDMIRQHAAAGNTVVVSSHLLTLVEDLCSHVLILNRGQTLFVGPMAELRETFGADDGSVTLEEIFFRATEGQAAS